MTRITEAVGRIASRVAQRFLKIGPTDEPIAWLSLVATALLGYQEAVAKGLGPEDAIVGALILVVTALVRRDVTPSAHMPDRLEMQTTALPPPYFPEDA